MDASLARCRGGLLLLVLALGWAPLLWLVGPVVSTDPDTLEECVSTGLGWALLGGWAWWCASAGLMAAEVAATGAATRTAGVAPRAARALVAAACGAGVLGGLTGPVAADPVDGSPHLHVLDGLGLPDRATGAARGTPASAGVRRDAVLTVQAGDTLWALAEDLEIGWTDLYAANRATIGPDPDLILPGQHLVIPSHTHHEGATR